MREEAHFIVVNYHGSAALPSYLDSLLTQECAAWRMTIVDNSQDADENRRLLRNADVSAPVRVIRAPGNLGYFGAVDWLLSQPGVRPAAWTVVSNMDIQLRDPAFVERLLGMNGRAPVLAPAIVSLPGQRPQNPYLVTRPSVRTMWRRRLMLGNPVVGQAAVLASNVKSSLKRFEQPAVGDRRPIYAPHGSIIPIHQRFFAAGGSLRHPVFLFNEEITIAEQCRRLGLSVMFEPSLRVIHRRHQSTGLLRSWRVLRAQGDAARYAYKLIAGARS